MIFLFHNNGKFISAEDDAGNPIQVSGTSSVDALLELAHLYPSEIIIWCDADIKHNLNREQLPVIFHHDRILASYGGESLISYMSDDIGYVEDSPFLNIKEGVTYPTWLMHQNVGGIASKVLLAIDESETTRNRGFNYFLNSLARKLQPQGLFCYNEPSLLKEGEELQLETKKISDLDLYVFVREHYKSVWLFLLFFCQARYDKKIRILPFLNALVFFKKKELKIDFSKIPLESSNIDLTPFHVDVIIPTLGRSEYLYNVLLDFKKQTLKPNNIIIVEQDPDSKSVSALSFLEDEEWPFEITHIFIHKTGACNARNVAISKTTAPWIFLFDDDNRFEPALLEDMRTAVEKTGSRCINMSYLQRGELEQHKVYKQWETFGSGCSLVHRLIVTQCSFDMALEHGYGEDADFGMQIRKNGFDIIYTPQIQIMHLKALVGGFRAPIKFPWQTEAQLSPKPSPQVMYQRMKNTTTKQLRGYKLVLFLKFYKVQRIRNPFAYYSYFKRAWASSQHWASKLPLDA